VCGERLRRAGRELRREHPGRPEDLDPMLGGHACELLRAGQRGLRLGTLRQPLAESYAALAKAAAVAPQLPHRERVLLINHRLARCILDAHAAWLDEAEAEAELRGAADRRR
jgi:hypothetical protein